MFHYLLNGWVSFSLLSIHFSAIKGQEDAYERMTLACDWFGTAGDVQLIPQLVAYWFGGEVLGVGDDNVLSANCEQVYLIREDIFCE